MGNQRKFPSRAIMNRIVMDYLVTEGFKDAAIKFMEEAKITQMKNNNFSSIDHRIVVRDYIKSGHISEAINKINQLYPELLENDRNLYFHLRQQQLIELIRKNDIENALDFAAEQLAELAQDDSGRLGELECTMALLAFDDPNKSPFSDLMSKAHVQKVI